MRWFLVFVFAAGLMVFTGCTKEKTYPAPPIRDNKAIIDLDGLQEGVPSFFTFFAEDRQKINFFVVKKKASTEAYFDACEKCYYKKRGYLFAEGSLVCKDCNISFGVNELKQGFGSCHPVPIKGTVKDNRLIIALDELKKGKRFF